MTKSSINNNGNGGTDNVEFISFVDQVNQLLEDCDKMTMRAMNRIPKENELLLPNEVAYLLIIRLLKVLFFVLDIHNSVFSPLNSSHFLNLSWMIKFVWLLLLSKSVVVL